MAPYVCAFRGRRDSYQVPLALAEAGLLDSFITDAYAGPVLRKLAALVPYHLRRKIRFRHLDGIPDSQVKCLWLTTCLEHLRHQLGFDHEGTYQFLDPRFSIAAGRRADTSGANLLLYSSYAWEAFHRNYRHSPRKVLFQYHPHPDFENAILEKDMEWNRIFSRPGPSGIPEASRGDRNAWKHSDIIFCASSFTKDSLVAAGCDESLCRVIPYGVDLTPYTAKPGSVTCGFQALFVGSGIQRKGLHHLLLAWDCASLPTGSSLTLVCRTLDDRLRGLIKKSKGVTLLEGVTASKLETLYASSHLFVMPSLVEGFGQVYLESLARGCPVLGTTNTCLPDLGNEDNGVFLTPPGDVDALIANLETLSRNLPGDAKVRTTAQATAETWTWFRFRHDLITSLPV